MIGSVEEKAEYKKRIIPYIVGALLLFSSSNLVQLVYDITLNEGSSNVGEQRKQEELKEVNESINNAKALLERGTDSLKDLEDCKKELEATRRDLNKMSYIEYDIPREYVDNPEEYFKYLRQTTQDLIDKIEDEITNVEKGI